MVRWVGSLLVGVAAVGIALLTAPTEAHAQSCFPADGGNLPDLSELAAEEIGAVQFVGRGWGHGVGMSQHGARGAALLGCDREDILTTYYAGVALGSADTEQPLVIGLTREGSGTDVTHPYLQVQVEGSGPLTWRLAGDDGGEVAEQPAGARWRVEVAGEPEDDDDPEEGAFVLRDADGDEVATAGARGDRLRADLDGTIVRLPDKTLGRWSDGVRYDRGTLDLTSRDGDRPLEARLGLASFEEYLYGLAEMPASWPEAALDAQAVVGRSFALAQDRGGRHRLVDTVNDQVYAGHEYSQDARWRAAVDRTAGEVLTRDERVVTGNYSSSAGGATDSNAFVWGGTPADHLVGVDTSRWEVYGVAGTHDPGPGDDPRGLLGWADSFSVDDASARLADAGHDVGAVLDIDLPEPRGTGGRAGHPSSGAGGVVVTGTDDEVTLSGERARGVFGLSSAPYGASVELPACEPPADAGPLERIERLDGPDRIATAVAVAGDFGSADAVVVASARDFPDALAGGALAADLGAPLLLTEPGQLPAAVAERIEDLGAERAVVLGGQAAVSAQVEDALAAVPGIDAVDRIGGDDRFHTAALVAAEVGADADEVALALGQAPEEHRAWPDAVASGALLAGDDAPSLLLTRGEELPQATLDALGDLDVDRVTLVGGTAAIADDVADALGDLGLATERLSGADRWATSADVVAEALARGASPDGMVFATGEDFPDALAAGALAAERGEPLALVPYCDLQDGAPVFDLVTDGSGATAGVVVGGEAAVSARVAWQLDEILDR